MPNMGVANINRSPNGERYTITDNDSRVVGYVETTGTLTNVRNRFDEPERVGSPRYEALLNAVKHYQAWAGDTKCQKVDREDSRELEEYDDYLDDGIVWDIGKHGYSYAD